MGNGNWGMGNGKWEIGTGNWEMGNAPAGGTWENHRKIGNMKGKWDSAQFPQQVDLPGEPGGVCHRACLLDIE